MATDVVAEQQHYQLEEPNLQWFVEKEEDVVGEGEIEEDALERRKYQELVSSVVVLPLSSSSTSTCSSPDSMKEISWNGVGLQLTTDLLDGHPGDQKQEEVFEDDNGRDEAEHHETENEDTKLSSEAARANGVISTTVSKTQHKNSVYLDSEQGTKTNNALSDIRNGVSSILEFNGESGANIESSELQKLLSNEVNHHCAKPSKYNGPVGPELPHTVSLYVSNNKDGKKSGVVAREGAAVEAINSELTELDVEAVLEKQETHDLFCPNCNSCITKRVILRKRKRRVPDLDSQGKRDKPEAAVSSELVNVEALANPGDGPILAPIVDGSRQVTGSPNSQIEPTSVSDPDGPEVFRCLSCFSFFIPAAGNLFRRGASEPGNAKRAQEEPATNAHWFFSIFKSNKGATTSQGDSSKAVHQTLTDPSSSMTSVGKVFIRTEAQELSPAPHNPDLEVNGVETRDKKSYTTKNESSSSTGLSFYPGIGHDVPIAETSIDKNGFAESNKFGRTKLEGINVVPSISDYSKAIHHAQRDYSKAIHHAQRDSGSNGKVLEAREFSSAPYLVNLEANGVQVGDKIPYTTAEGYVPSNAITDGKLEVEDSGNKINTGSAARQAQQGGSDFMPSSSMDLDESMNSINQKPQPVGSYITEFSAIRFPAIEKLENCTYQETSIVVDVMESAQSTSAVPGEIQVSNGVNDLQNISMNPTVSSADQITVVHKVNISPGEKINTDIELNKTGGDVIVTVESSSSQGANNYIISETATLEASSTQVHNDRQGNAEAGEYYKLEILKSIVYGGLIESVTSLSVVSSAVAGGAAALNVVALGLASLVGGLIVMVDNLLDLKSHPSYKDHPQVTAQDRYQELLGRRANFGVHITVAILSYLVFGSIPLATYGFLERKKCKSVITMAAVLAASLLCIILLASAQVSTKRPPKSPKSYVKTVSYYLTMAVAASGISYVLGDLVREILEKYNQPQPQTQTGLNMITGFLDGTGNGKPTWSSY